MENHETTQRYRYCEQILSTIRRYTCNYSITTTICTFLYRNEVVTSVFVSWTLF